MGRIGNLLGFDSAPKIGSRYNGCDCDGSPSLAQGQQLVPMERIQSEGNFFQYRAFGTYSLIPGRALSAQTRLKNKEYELPSATWTDNLEGPAWVVRVPGIPTKVNYLPTITDYTTQPQFLSPIANLQIQNNYSWFGRLRAAVLGHFASGNEETQNAALTTMFPSVYGE